MVEIKTVLKNCDAATLRQLYKSQFSSELLVPKEEKEIIKKLTQKAEAIGLKRMLHELKGDEISALSTALSVDLKSGSESKSNHQKRINAHFEELAKGKKAKTALADAMAGLSTDEQTPILEVLGLDDIKNGTARTNSTAITNQIKQDGLSSMLSTLSPAILRQIAGSMKLKLDTTSTNSILEYIVTGKKPEKREHVVADRGTISKKKPDLSAKISEADIQQHYNKTELEDFAREKGIPVAGKKRELGQRIIQYFEDGETVAERPAKRQKKAAAPKKKATTTKKTTTKKAASPKKDAAKSPKKTTKKTEEKAEDATEEKTEEKEEKAADKTKTPEKKGKKSDAEEKKSSKK